MGLRAYLVLADGTCFTGSGFGHEGEAEGEVVFNTSLTGYQEILTDPSYKGQIVTMTYPQIGNYGVNAEDVESAGGPRTEGFVVKEYMDFPSNWRSVGSLADYLKEHRIVAIEGIDTRALTRHIRDRGSQMGIISTTGGADPRELYGRIKDHPGIGGVDLAGEVTSQETYSWTGRKWRWGPAPDKKGLRPKKKGLRPLKVTVYDFGVKQSILRCLVDAGFEVTVVPASTPPGEVLDSGPDGILLSNGPGDPGAVTYAIEAAKELIGKKPIFGICLGHQIIGLALGGRTYKLKFGHHGGNHPVMDIATGKVEITSQNHNYCVDVSGIGDSVTLTHRNLYDGTEEGMVHRDFPLMSVQHHPEAGPGPNDASHVFMRFRSMIEAS